MSRCWILVGMMGAGKSSVGRALADLSGRTFHDTDQILQQKLGRPIPQIFSVYGEDAFRDHETSVLKSLCPDSCVLATGGGIVCRTENWDEMRRLGTTIYLRASMSTLLQRLERSKKKRPLLEVEGWDDRLRELLAARMPLYEQADFSVDVDNMSVDEAAGCIMRAVNGS